ncbi:AAEL004626-PA [Aedes aegypti]|uniref:AAEL004626-PA n=1 Tax=Aedes aegypti TaxID=7159 RepID=Q17CC9_AEDAE|nr:AAEL004626-PA [Aedes aegypti]
MGIAWNGHHKARGEHQTSYSSHSAASVGEKFIRQKKTLVRSVIGILINTHFKPTNRVLVFEWKYVSLHINRLTLFITIADIFYLDDTHSSSKKGTARLSRRSLKYVLEDVDDNDENPLYRSVTGFKFPLTTPQMVEDLEQSVRASEHIRLQYVALLRKARRLAEKPSLAFLKLFDDAALLDYNYSGRCNFSGVQKKAMKDYHIFVECIHEAWGGESYTTEELRQYICNAITLVNNRKRGARFRKNQRSTRLYKK